MKYVFVVSDLVGAYVRHYPVSELAASYRIDRRTKKHEDTEVGN